MKQIIMAALLISFLGVFGQTITDPGKVIDLSDKSPLEFAEYHASNSRFRIHHRDDDG